MKRKFSSELLSGSAALLTALLLGACGDAAVPDSRANPDDSNTGDEDSAAADDSTLDDKAMQDLAAGGGVSWQLWNCDDADASETGEKDGMLMLGGIGPHEFPMTETLSFPLTMTGNICTPLQMGRDIVFVVDISISMRNQFNQGTDPVVAGSCNRLKAVTAVIDNLADNTNARFAFITFDGSVHQDSEVFYSAADFKASFANAATLCTVGADATNFKIPLERAEEILKTSQPQASKEVFLITDGFPATQPEYGIDTAARLHSRGLVATVMIGLSDATVRNKLASKNSAGNPLHLQVAGSAQIPAQILDFAASTLIGGKFSYAAEANGFSGAEITLDLEADQEFSIGDVEISQGAFPGGVEATLRFWDSRSALYTRKGTIIWK